MEINKKSAEKRRIGPAMQWAKSRSASERANDRTRRKINLDLDLDTEWDSHQPETEVSRQGLSSEQDNLEYRPEHSYPDSSSASTDGSYNRSPGAGERLRLMHNPERNYSSAWDYYSGDSSQRHYDYSSLRRTSQVRDYPNYDEASSVDRTQLSPGGATAGSRYFGSSSRERTYSPGLRQLLLPILVVAIIVIVGLLSSFG